MRQLLTPSNAENSPIRTNFATEPHQFSNIEYLAKVGVELPVSGSSDGASEAQSAHRFRGSPSDWLAGAEAVVCTLPTPDGGGKNIKVVCVAIARELLGFIWDYRLGSTSITRLASSPHSKHSNASSAKRISSALPFNLGRTSCSNHTSSTSCK